MMIFKILKNVNWIPFLYFCPLLILVFYFFYQSQAFNLHDFSNSYFSARMIREGFSPSQLFDIYEFNSYIWSLGYQDVLVDFYINSPFTISFFYPLSFIDNPYIAKAFFNFMSIVLFIGSLYVLIHKKLDGRFSGLMLLPIIFFVPIRNQILFGQSYFLIFALVIFGFLFLEKNKKVFGASALSLAVLLKIFPVFYLISLFFYKSWKSILGIIIAGSILMIGALIITGSPVWELYFTEILPNTIQNNSTVDFRYNAQSIDVFLRYLFIEDSYYNPNALFNNERLYFLFKWIFKSVVIAFAIRVSYANKKNLFKLLSIWIVALFLLQSRTATYAHVLWIIPTICLLNQKLSTTKKIVFLIILLIVCNIPVNKLDYLPIVLKFSRLWLSILLAIIFFKSFSVKINYKWIIIVFVVLLPLHLGVFKENELNNSAYALEKKEHFLIYDFFEKEGSLFIKTLGRNGDQIVNTLIPVSSFNENVFEVVDNQIMMNEKVILKDHSLKKKPVLVNNSEVYYLTDHHSRRGAYTLKKLSVEKVY